MTNPKFPGLTLTTAKITVTTDTPDLAVSATALNIGAAANSTDTFSITSNIAWNVSSSEGWLTVSTLSGSLNDTITLTAAANLASTIRTAIVTVSGIGISTDTITVTQAKNTTTIAEVKIDKENIYPNPVKDKVHIDISINDLPSLIGIYTLNGELLINKQANTSLTEINLENYPSGIYIMRLTTPFRTVERKIIKR